MAGPVYAHVISALDSVLFPGDRGSPLMFGKAMIKSKIIDRLHRCGIEELSSVVSLNELNGDYINLECKWPNGATGKILDDRKRYYAIQVERPGSDRCLGVAADENQIAVFSYGCGGKDAELVQWIRLEPGQEKAG